jgi:hypothetical protein
MKCLAMYSGFIDNLHHLLDDAEEKNEQKSSCIRPVIKEKFNYYYFE